MAEEDDTTYRIIRAKVPRKRHDTQPSTPRALADGSGEVHVSPDESRELGELAPPSSALGTMPRLRTRSTTNPPPATPTPMPAPTIPRAPTGQLRDGTSIEFGNMTIRVRHHGGVVHLELSDGTRLSGSDAQACELAALLLRAGARR